MTTVVLSEPDRPTRRLASSALRFAGYSVETAHSLGQSVPICAAGPRRRWLIPPVISMPSPTSGL
jgi:hypothetical protein